MTDTWTKGQWVDGLAEWTEGSTAYLSVAFTWRVDEAYSKAIWYRALGYRVIAGGPAFFQPRFRHEMHEVAEVPTKIVMVNGRLVNRGADLADAVARHNPMATFASRGCPVGCSFCIVPAMEGESFTELPDFPVRPVLCDNNLSALSPAYQDHIVGRYRSAGVPLIDANSGFEPRTFDEEVFRRWSPINRGPWRFAYDDEGDGPHVERVMRMLRHVSPRRKQVYVLIGNEPREVCLARIRRVIEWGGEPYVQPLMKLNVSEKRPWVRFDWTEHELGRVKRWINGRFWKYTPLELYHPSVRTGRRSTTAELDLVGVGAMHGVPSASGAPSAGSAPAAGSGPSGDEPAAIGKPIVGRSSLGSGPAA